jgi:hypothetical protein
VWILLVAACSSSVGLESWQPEPGRPFVDIEPRGRVEFPATSPAGPSVEVEVTATNSGDAAATLDDAWIEGSESGVFFLEQLPLPTSVEAGEGFTFPVHFQPVDRGSFQATLVVQAGEGAVVERLLLGSGCSDTDGDGDC